ncbi:AAA family ATPase [Spiroplasma endosymbiont of Labia minor]|uniref:AAA family ATPase n=1 Tax=Spiroplasma endosymbiont of Labia minor TaxID=3066305 RepID=UPI0030CAC203
MRSRIERLVQFLSQNLYEREDVIRLTLLAMFGGESIFLYGKPGLGKSFIAKAIKTIIKNGKIFEYLMNKYSTPEEIFGPLDINKLSDGHYVRLIDGYLPSADICFLDEIWKAGPSIQNTLLTIINEKEFRNGTQTIKVPLKLLIAASNEFPEENQGLEALYDRFILRFETEPLNDFDNVLKMVGIGTDVKHELLKLNDADLVTPENLIEISNIVDDTNGINFSSDTIDFIRHFKINLETKSSIYISDRRWKKTLRLMKVSALCSDRKIVEIADTFVIKHCFWNNINNNGVDERAEIKLIYDEIVQKITGVSDDVSWAETEIKTLTNNVKGYLKNNLTNKEYIDELGIRYKSILKGLNEDNGVISKASSIFSPFDFDRASSISSELRQEFEKTFFQLQKKVIKGS